MRSADLVTPSFARYASPLRLRPGNWAADVFNVWVATIILSEQLQVPVEIVQYADEDVLAKLEKPSTGGTTA